MGSYDYRLALDGKFGYLSGSVDALATTLTSPSFATLPVITTTSVEDYIPITLADDTIPALETVWVTGHTDGSQAVTVVRGREGTTAKQWTTGATWRMAATSRDLIVPVANRGSLPSDTHLGARAALIDEGVEVTRRPAGWTGKGKYGWSALGVSLAARAAVTTISALAAVAAQPSDPVPTVASGVLKLNKPGFWAIMLHCYGNPAAQGVNGNQVIGMDWAGGGWSHLFTRLQDKRSVIYTGGNTGTATASNESNQTLSWSGWVTPAQAAAGLTVIGKWDSSTDGARLCDFYLDVEQLW